MQPVGNAAARVHGRARRIFPSGSRWLVEAGKRADLLVIDARPKDAYGARVRAKEDSVRLVLINGIARYGAPDLMQPLGAGKGQSLTFGGEKRIVYLEQKTEDPDVAAISLKTAKATLTQALKDLPDATKFTKAVPAALGKSTDRGPLVWQLAWMS